MILFICKQADFKYKNIKFSANLFKHEKNVIKNLDISAYPSVIQLPNDDVHIYYRKGNGCMNESIKRIVSTNHGKTFTREKVELARRKAFCHNFVMFIDENPGINDNERVKGIGGKHCIYKIYKNRPGKNPLIDGRKFDENLCKYFIDHERWTPDFVNIFSHLEKCDNYANGLHCFIYKDNQLVDINKDLPIVSGLHPGRHEGFYGKLGIQKIKSLDQSLNNGISIFDGAHNIIYDRKNSVYILYARANISQGNRYVQYAISKDCKTWSEFNLIKINGWESHIFVDNFYYSNFFQLDDGVFLAILPHTRRTQDIKSWTFGGPNRGIYTAGKYLLMSSVDGIHWDVIGKVLNYNYEKSYLAIGKPILSEDKSKHYFYLNNNKNINLYSIPVNRFGNIQADGIGELEIPDAHITSRELKLNCEIDAKGYVQIIFQYNDGTISHKKQVNIKGPCDEINKKIGIPEEIKENKKYCIKLIFSNSKLYSLEGIQIGC